ncbi:intraflagellar transport protein 81 homolog [Planococcus citri]|uniref:intraflagellar transport protein 81 homolog n=1 Tax=Planococcus citri TaxID=170843 RepID=UPI0031F75DFE
MEIVKSVVDKLNKPPFSKNFNIISFDSLSSEELLQVLSDVLQYISDQEKIDIHAEESEQTVVRILSMLLIARYKPLQDSAAIFRQNLQQCDKQTVHKLLEWLLSNMEDLKKRMYLAKFLVKVDVPSDILGDSDIAILHQQYLQLIEEFKKIHKESTLAKTGNKISISELRSDGVTMEKEKEIVTNRIYHIKKKIDSLPNIAALLRSTHNLRQEYDRKKEIAWQQQEESVTIQQCQQRLYRLSQQLQELQKRSVGLSSQALMKKLEEEIYVTSYIANQKLPRELQQQKKEKEIMETIAYSPNVTKSSNEQLESKVQTITQHINQLVENRLSSSTIADDKTVLFRQQAAIVARKKDNLAEKFSELKKQLQEVRSKLEDKQHKLEEMTGEGGVILKSSEHFQEYVSKLRTRSLIYKRYRNDLATLKAESGILSRTVDILRSKADQVGVDLSTLQDIQDTEPQQPDIENKTSETLLSLITQLTANISSQKAKLAPLVAGVKPLQEELRQLTTEHDECKRVYDRTNMSLNTNLTKLINEVNTLEEFHNKTSAEVKNLSEKIQKANDDLKRAVEEFHASLEKNNSKPLVKERLQQRIVEEERINRMLKEEQIQVRDNEHLSMKQKDAWNNLCLLMQVKLKCWQQEKEDSNTIVHKERGAETLVLL